MRTDRPSIASPCGTYSSSSPGAQICCVVACAFANETACASRYSGFLPRISAHAQAGARPRTRIASACIALMSAQPWLRPAEPGAGRGLRAVFAADPAVVTELVEEREEIRIIDLAHVRLVTVGNAGDLHVPHARDVLAQLHREIAFDDLAVVEVHLHLQVRRADVGADGVRLVLAVEEVAGNVARVDWLDDDANAGGGGLGRGEREIVQVRGAMALAIVVRADEPRH